MSKDQKEEKEEQGSAEAISPLLSQTMNRLAKSARRFIETIVSVAMSLFGGNDNDCKKTYTHEYKKDNCQIYQNGV